MLVRIAKWGNSLALRIPAAHARELGLAENTKAELEVRNSKLVLTPLDAVPSFDLDALVAQITDENRHAEIETGPAVGKKSPDIELEPCALHIASSGTTGRPIE